MSEHGLNMNVAQTTKMSKHPPFLANKSECCPLTNPTFSYLHFSHLLDKMPNHTITCFLIAFSPEQGPASLTLLKNHITPAQILPSVSNASCWDVPQFSLPESGNRPNLFTHRCAFLGLQLKDIDQGNGSSSSRVISYHTRAPSWNYFTYLPATGSTWNSTMRMLFLWVKTLMIIKVDVLLEKRMAFDTHSVNLPTF